MPEGTAKIFRRAYDNQYQPLEPKVYDTQKLQELPPVSTTGQSDTSMVYRAELSKDERYAFFARADETLQVNNLEDGSVVLSRDDIARVQFSPDGTQIAIHSIKKSKVDVIDLATKKTLLSFPSGSFLSRAIVFSPNGQKIAYTSNNSLYLNDFFGQQSTSVTIPALNWGNQPVYSPDGSQVFVPHRGKLLKVDTQVSCITDDLQIEASAPPKQDQIQALQESICDQPFNKDVWNRYLPQNPKQLTFTDAMIYLKKFQKLGGFEGDQDLPVLVAILKSQTAKENIAQVQAALQTISLSRSLLGQALLNEFPEFFKPVSTVNQSQLCRTPAETAKLVEQAFQYANDFRGLLGDESHLEDWNQLAFYAPLFSQNPQKQDLLAESIGLSITNAAAREYPGIFYSKLYKFVAQGVAPLVGKKPISFSDFTLVREGVLRIKPVILGTDDMDADNDNAKEKFGFFKKQLGSFEIERSDEEGQNQWPEHLQTSWKHNGDTFEVSPQIALSGKKNFIKQDPAAPYAELWADQKLTGLVMTGSSMGPTASRNVMDEYIFYWQSQGFEVSSPEPINDVSQFLEQKIHSGEVDYFIKEAHSDGDEKNLFRFDSQSSLMKATKTLPDGRREVVYLLYPSKAQGETQLLSNNDFGSWIRDREQNKQGSLVYFNTSCFSAPKAVNEIQEAGSAKLINIPTINVAKTFSNNPDVSAQRQMFDAFRNQKTYSEMRDSMAETKERGANKSHFIFPDEEEYADRVIKKVALPLNIQLNLKKNGKPWNIDEAH